MLLLLLLQAVFVPPSFRRLVMLLSVAVRANSKGWCTARKVETKRRSQRTLSGTSSLGRCRRARHAHAVYGVVELSDESLVAWHDVRASQRSTLYARLSTPCALPTHSHL
ncbi:hypothetical protein DFH11DRAFT_1620731 [Phellopilus nigrolimitatus]|nr:hypothetical protein DFH11DRAFT_1620731 [Phellopilus nigrolimitatus]